MNERKSSSAYEMSDLLPRAFAEGDGGPPRDQLSNPVMVTEPGGDGCGQEVGACAGFLLYNFSPATIFMGDAGSLPLGFLMGLLTILTTYYDPSKHLSPVGVVVPLLVLAVPLYDVVSVVIHRHRAGQSPLRGDRRHFSHRLVRRGLTTRGAVLTIYLATASTGLPAILLPTADWSMAVLLMVQCLCGVGIIAILEHAGGTPR